MSAEPRSVAAPAGATCHVDSIDDPRLADFRFLRERDLLEREGQHGHPGSQARHGIFIGEGLLVAERMARQPGVLRHVLVAEDRLDEASQAGIVQAAEAVCVAPRRVVVEVTGFHFHRGLIASGYRAPLESRTPASVLAAARLALLCDEISNMDNAGALFRDAAAFGVEAVVLSHGSHDPLYRKCLRTSMGHALSVPFARARAAAGEGSLAGIVAEMVAGGWLVLATTLAENALELDEFCAADLGRAGGTGSAPVSMAIVVGHEFRGVSPDVAAACSHRVRIRMAPGVDSLNVSVAAAVTLHALRRMQDS